MRIVFLLALLLSTLLCTCDRAQPNAADPDDRKVSAAQRAVNEASTITIEEAPNPAAEGFNSAGSDERAIAIADSIVKHHGGRAAWDATRYLTWNFFGARTLLWDRYDKRARIDAPSENTVYLLDYSGEEPTGRMRIKGNEVTDPDTLAEAMQKAYGMLINDSYWLVQQFKLKDSGVTLTAAEDVITDPEAGRPSHVLDLTFDGVGNTPQNRYRLFVDKRTYHINTWQFFRDAEDAEPAMQTPWNELLPYRGLLLSGDRGGNYQLNNIGAPKQVRERLFTEF